MLLHYYLLSASEFVYRIRTFCLDDPAWHVSSFHLIIGWCHPTQRRKGTKLSIIWGFMDVSDGMAIPDTVIRSTRTDEIRLKRTLQYVAPSRPNWRSKYRWTAIDRLVAQIVKMVHSIHEWICAWLDGMNGVDICATSIYNKGRYITPVGFESKNVVPMLRSIGYLDLPMSIPIPRDRKTAPPGLIIEAVGFLTPISRHDIFHKL